MIRLADKKDIKQILGLIKEFYEESLKDLGLSFKAKTLEVTISNFIENQISIVAEKNSSLIGVIGGFVAKSIFDEDELIAQEAIWYVSKDERKGTVGVRLMKEFEKECLKRGANFITMICMDNLNPELMKRFYKGSGYKLMENHYIKGV